MPGWHVTLIDCGFHGGPHTIHITTPTDHHYLSRGPRSAMTGKMTDLVPIRQRLAHDPGFPAPDADDSCFRQLE
jgi:hypothetical protein